MSSALAAVDLEFRVVADADADDLATLRVEAMRASLERVGRFDPDRARRRLLDTFSAAHTRAIVDGGMRVGFFVVKALDDGLVLEHLYVHPLHQRRGIGAAVLRQVFAEADALGVALRVGALKDSESNAFYRRHGFVLEEEAGFDNHYVRLPDRRPERAA